MMDDTPTICIDIDTGWVLFICIENNKVVSMSITFEPTFKSIIRLSSSNFVVHYMINRIYQYGSVLFANKKIMRIGMMTIRIVMRNLVATIVGPKLTLFLVVFAETWTIAQ
jgi:hypothetical protein